MRQERPITVAGVKKTMKREPVESSMIASVGYDPEAQELEVEFNNSGQVYVYYEVPKEEYDGLMAAESKGIYMHNNIIDSYGYARVSKRRRSRY
jgi:hypothetical protein